jgi:hypothetical protein
MTHPNQTLSEEIEQLVREHIEASRRAASAAVQRAFASSSSSPRSKMAQPTGRTIGRRRAPTEVAALGERLHEAVCAEPGETMSVLGPRLGMTPRELHRPMMVLKRAGRVRSVGERHQTRYFPAVVRAAASGG